MTNMKYLLWVGGVVVVALVAYLVLRPMPAAAPEPQSPVAVAQPAVQAPSAGEYHDNIYLVKTDPAKGSYLADFNGTALYIYDKDTTGISTCTGGCAKAWPPYTSGAVAEGTLPTGVTVIARADGSKQFAWQGKPLYYYSGDKNPGDVTGDGIAGVWHLAKP